VPERPALTFPDGFLWGAATAAYQIEGAARDGGRGPSVWDDFSHTPGKVAHGHTGDVACDHYHRVEQDVALMAEVGLRAYRFSISWPRVQPDGRGAVNDTGVAWYSRLVDLLLEHDIVPCPTLFHWDLPSALEELGGLRHRDTAKRFADYAALMADRLGDRVTMWSTFNEPWCYAYLGHAIGHHAPGLGDPTAAVTVAHHELLAHGWAVQAMRAERSALDLGIVLNPSNVEREGTPDADEDDIRRLDGLKNRWWSDAVFRGAYPDDIIDDLGPLASAIQPGDVEQIAQPLDWVGINYYFDMLVRGMREDDGADQMMHPFPTVTSTTDSETRPDHTDMGWPITPDGFTKILLRMHTEYPNLPPVYITENGCAYDDPVIDGRCADRRRIDYLDRHLRALRAAIAAGVDVRGYFQWSLLDNFEWALGYDKRFGLFHVDFDTLERTPRDSAHWYRDVIARNGLAAVDG
jgi:beta-glucosidase